jgi:hypothetical protein
MRRPSLHTGDCEFVSADDPSALRVLLKIKPGLGGGYDWLECGACGAGWQVPYESVGWRRVDTNRRGRASE